MERLPLYVGEVSNYSYFHLTEVGFSPFLPLSLPQSHGGEVDGIKDTHISIPFGEAGRKGMLKLLSDESEKWHSCL